MASYFSEDHFNSYRITDSVRSVLNESRSFSYTNKTTVFISHKHDDLKIIQGFLGFLKNMDVVTYIDAFDPTMPDYTCGKTAERIKERIKQCDKFMLLATDNAITSKWCNWELGIGDVHKYKANIAIAPVKNADRDIYTGSEFLEIYPYLFQGSSGSYYIYDPTTKQCKSLKEWLKK